MYDTILCNTSCESVSEISNYGEDCESCEANCEDCDLDCDSREDCESDCEPGKGTKSCESLKWKRNNITEWSGEKFISNIYITEDTME